MLMLLTWEYIDYTRQYFDIYEKYQQENREALINVIELQNRLKNVTLDWTNMKASNRELESLAMHDELTGLANRTFLHEYFTSSFEHAYEEHELMGVQVYRTYSALCLEYAETNTKNYAG